MDDRLELMERPSIIFSLAIQMEITSFFWLLQVMVSPLQPTLQRLVGTSRKTDMKDGRDGRQDGLLGGGCQSPVHCFRLVHAMTWCHTNSLQNTLEQNGRRSGWLSTWLSSQRSMARYVSKMIDSNHIVIKREKEVFRKVPGGTKKKPHPYVWQGAGASPWPVLSAVARPRRPAEAACSAMVGHGQAAARSHLPAAGGAGETTNLGHGEAEHFSELRPGSLWQKKKK